MGQRRRGRAFAGLALVATLAACGRPGAGPAQQGPELRLSYQDRAEPSVFAREGPAVRDDPDGSAGLWAAVRGLPRPERARVVNPANGAEVVVALFAAGPGGPDIRLSNQAADALGIATRPVTVQITALRRELQIDTTKGRF